MNTVTLIIKTDFVGFHYWEDAPEQVAFLRGVHRHIFNIEAEIPVTELNRELEFFIIKQNLNTFIEINYKSKTFKKSCEMIASEIKNFLDTTYKRDCAVSVFEDNENGARVA